ncbi:MAG: radical SAM protein [Bacteroidales bacterium]|nr:MAG: radical SAM protein [Bacteroidales bacterium]
MLTYKEGCSCCPRKCDVRKDSLELGFCNTTDHPMISSIFLHNGEEPIISGNKGICNVFFAHCNLRCVYCQNYQISQNDGFEESWLMSVETAADRIIEILNKGVNLLGFVSPSHQIPQMLRIVDELRLRRYKPIIVYNSNGYDSVSTLRVLEGIVDVYLPDFKYFSNDLAREYSGVTDYFEVASKALREMYRQKGSTILLGDDGLIESGMVVRHLVLPGSTDDSVSVLEFIADEISPSLHISLMSQYYPTEKVCNTFPLNRKISKSEYLKVVSKLEVLGFKGWIQDIDSSDLYRPDFNKKNPFSG